MSTVARREKSVFGEYLVQQIKEAGMTLGEDFTLEVAPRETNGKKIIF